jgi:hypothetical protein
MRSLFHSLAGNGKPAATNVRETARRAHVQHLPCCMPWGHGIDSTKLASRCSGPGRAIGVIAYYLAGVGGFGRPLISGR